MHSTENYSKIDTISKRPTSWEDAVELVLLWLKENYPSMSLGNLRINLNDVKDEQQHLLITFVLLNPILCVLGNDPQRSLKTLIKKLNTSVPPLSFLTSEYLKKLGQMTGVAAPPVQQVKKQHLRYGQSVLGCQTSVPTGECYYNGE